MPRTPLFQGTGFPSGGVVQLLCYYVKRPLSGNWERTKRYSHHAVPGAFRAYRPCHGQAGLKAFVLPFCIIKQTSAAKPLHQRTSLHTASPCATTPGPRRTPESVRELLWNRRRPACVLLPRFRDKFSFPDRVMCSRRRAPSWRSFRHKTDGSGANARRSALRPA